NSGAWTILGNGARRHVHVDVELLEPRRIDPEIGGTVLDDAERRLSALAHHLAQLAGQDQPSAPGRACRLDEQDVTANRRPGKTGGDAGNAGAHRKLALELGGAQHAGQVLGGDTDRSLLAFGDAHGSLPQRLADLALETAHARLARVVLDDVAHRLVANIGVFRFETIGLKLAAHQIATRYLELFVGRIARERDHLHSIAQRTRHGIEQVGRGNEHDAAEIERHRQVVVAEGAVLFRVEYLQQRRTGVALDAASELVDFVEHHHAIAGSRLANGLDDVTGQRADVGTPMTADFGLVVHAAKAHSHEFSYHGAGNRLPQRRL